MNQNFSKTHNILEKLKSAYLEDLPRVIDDIEVLILKLKKSFNEEYYQELVRLVRNIKGNGGTMGFQILSTVCHRFEDFLTQNDLNQKKTEKQINICFEYIDLLRISHDKLLSKSSSFDEIPGLNGHALAAAVRLSKSLNYNIKFILISTGKKKLINRNSSPDYIVNRSQNIISDFSRALEEILD